MKELREKTREAFSRGLPAPTNRSRVPPRSPEPDIPAGLDKQPAFAAPVIDFSTYPSSHPPHTGHDQRLGIAQKCAAISALDYLRSGLAPFRTNPSALTHNPPGILRASSASTIEKSLWKIGISKGKARFRRCTRILCGFLAPVPRS